MLVLSFVLLSIVKTRFGLCSLLSWSGEGLTMQRYDFFSYKTIYIYKYIYCGEKTQRNPTKPNETHVFPRKPAYPLLFPRKPTQSLWWWGGVSYLCIAIGVRALVFGLFSLRSPLDVPYWAARNGGVGLEECG